MTWQLVSNGRRPLLWPRHADRASLLPRGTLLVELPYSPNDGAHACRDRTLISIERRSPWPSQLRLSLHAGGIVRFEHGQGNTITSVETAFAPPDTGSHLRITLCWHAPQRIGLLAVEELSRGGCDHALYDAPQPLSLADCQDLARPRGAYVDPDVTALAISDAIEPIRLGGGFAAGAQIDTPSGPCRVEALRPGDEVHTWGHGPQPIRDVVSYLAPSVGQLAPMTIAAPFFGLERALCVSQSHRLLVMGADAEYLFGQEEVLLRADHLTRLAEPLSQLRPPVQRYVHLLLDAHVCLSVGGGWAESMYVGALADQPLDHALSVLADRPIQHLPRHAGIAGPQLHGYEAAVLVSALCA